MPKLGASPKRMLRGMTVSKTSSGKCSRTSRSTSRASRVRPSCIVRIIPETVSRGLSSRWISPSVIVPVQTEYYALEGLAGLLDTVRTIQRGANPRLSLAGMVLTMHDSRTRLAQDVEREVREHFPELVFDTVIPRNVRIGEAPSFGRPVIHHDPHCAGAEAYFALAKEVAARG